MDALFDTSSSSDEERDIEIQLHNLHQRLRHRRQPSRIQGFIEITISNSTDREFQEHFRITRGTFEILLQRLTPFLKKEDGLTGKNRISVDTQILSVLWLLGTPDSYRSVGNRFNVGKSSLFTCFYRVISGLNTLAPDIIKWPKRGERQQIKDVFQRMEGLPGVIGAIDGTYVPIKAPKDDAQVYINRKCFHAITLQAICIPTLAFIDCFTGYPSSVSDSRILRNSDIYTNILNNTHQYFDVNEYILGDKAYPLSDWLIPPFIDRGNLTEVQRRFNMRHAKTRQVIERAFALLFGRFRRLRYLDMNRVDLIPATIIAACVLHNVCLMHPDTLIQQYVNEGMPILNHDNNELEENREEGNNLRNILANT